MISYNSDVEGAERPVREKLKKTSIASLAQFNSIKSGQVQALTSNLQVEDRERQSDTELMSAVRGRPARKRSFDDLQKDDLRTSGDSGLSEELDKNVGHKRMRSRDVSGGDDAPSDGEPEPEAVDQEESDVDARRSPGGPGVLVEAPARTETTPSRSAPEAEESILSPKKKRSRDQFDKDEEHEDLASEDSRDGRGRPASDLADGGEPLAQMSSRTAKGEPEKKRPRDEEQNSITDEKLRAKGVCRSSVSFVHVDFQTLLFWIVLKLIANFRFKLLLASQIQHPSPLWVSSRRQSRQKDVPQSLLSPLPPNQRNKTSQPLRTPSQNLVSSPFPIRSAHHLALLARLQAKSPQASARSPAQHLAASAQVVVLTLRLLPPNRLLLASADSVGQVLEAP